jgi:hypothetical protein
MANHGFARDGTPRLALDIYDVKDLPTASAAATVRYQK